MKPSTDNNKTEKIDTSLLDLELRSNDSILNALASSQLSAVQATQQAIPQIDAAVSEAAVRLQHSQGRIIMAGAGASGRLAVQDGAELWPTYGWPANRLELRIAGGNDALLHSIEGVEDDAAVAIAEVESLNLTSDDVVLGLAASGSSPWTVAWVEHARSASALTIGFANNKATALLNKSEHPIFLNSGAEVLAGSTRMAAGTAQKIALNMFSTLLMIRLNRTYGNLMVDMAAANSKLDVRRMSMLQTLIPNLDNETASNALSLANGWVKLAALICLGQSKQSSIELLERCSGNLRAAMQQCEKK